MGSSKATNTVHLIIKIKTHLTWACKPKTMRAQLKNGKTPALPKNSAQHSEQDSVPLEIDREAAWPTFRMKWTASAKRTLS